MQYVFFLADIRGSGEGALTGAWMGALVEVPWLLAGFELHREAPVREEVNRVLRAIMRWQQRARRWVLYSQCNQTLVEQQKRPGQMLRPFCFIFKSA